jgi:hypothetical protein
VKAALEFSGDENGRMLTVRVSHERAAVDALVEALGELPGVQAYRGMGAANRLTIPGWDLTPLQLFQYGDLRLESPGATVVIEFESAGGVTNLLKSWPLLEAKPLKKRFVLAHVFRIQSKGDYIAHRQLWSYVIDKMKLGLADHPGLHWPRGWEARAFTYPSDSIDVSEVAAFARDALASAGNSR